MDRKKTWPARLGAACLALACLCGAALAAAGDRDDPLITLSYLTQTATPAILRDVEATAEKRQTELLEEFNRALSVYKGQLEGGGSVGGATFSTVSLAAGQRLSLKTGGEALLRGGSVKAAAALVDSTAGAELASGGALTINHLYLAAAGDCVLEAGGEKVTLLVRGEYSVLS